MPSAITSTDNTQKSAIKTEGVSDMNSLISQVQHLGTSADFWSSAVNWLIFATAFVAVLYFGATIKLSSVSKRFRIAQQELDKAKEEQTQRDIAKVSADAQVESTRIEGEAKKETARIEAESKKEIAAANKRSDEIAAKANQAAEELRGQNLKAQQELEAEKSKRIELEKNFTPRELMLKVNGTKKNIDPLSPFAGTKYVLEYLPDAESMRAADSIAYILKEAKWEMIGLVANPDLFTRFNDGVLIYTELPATYLPGPEAKFAEVKRNADAADAFVEFLESEDWVAARRNGFPKSEARPGLTVLEDNTVKISVGFKPNPYFQMQWVKDMDKKFKEQNKQFREQGKKLEQEDEQRRQEYERFMREQQKPPLRPPDKPNE